ncbi:hypothetical protein, partial [Mesotoga prima]|uniref:hypothetical protein n=1 Tax=Mesotoga prima TaxID=1184387 RepID=UPI002CCFCB99
SLLVSFVFVLRTYLPSYLISEAIFSWSIFTSVFWILRFRFLFLPKKPRRVNILRVDLNLWSRTIVFQLGNFA